MACCAAYPVLTVAVAGLSEVVVIESAGEQPVGAVTKTVPDITEPDKFLATT